MPVRLFVGNLPYDVTEDELRAFFAPIGPLAHAFIPVDRETGKRRGFAFVEFEDRSKADEAVKKLNNQSLRGRAVSVNEARPRESGGSGPRPGPGGGGGYHGPSPRPSFAAGSPPPFEPRSRNFGPDARPARNRKPPNRQFAGEEKKKGPIRERRRGRVFGFEDEDEGLNGTPEELEDELLTSPEQDLEGEEEQ